MRTYYDSYDSFGGGSFGGSDPASHFIGIQGFLMGQPTDDPVTQLTFSLKAPKPAVLELAKSGSR